VPRKIRRPKLASMRSRREAIRSLMPSLSVEPVETVVHGPLRDQAALHGLLARLQTFGVEVLEVRRLHDQQPAPPAADQPGE